MFICLFVCFETNIHYEQLLILIFLALLKYGEIHGHCNVAKRESFACELEDWPDENGCTKYEGKLGTYVCLSVCQSVCL